MDQNYRFRPQNTTYLLFFGATLVLFFIPLVLMIFQTARIYTFQRGNGTVVSSLVQTNEEVSGKKGFRKYRYYQIVEYAKEGQSYSFKTNQAYDFDRYKVHENVKIFYNPNNLSEGAIDDETMYLGTAILSSIYVISLIFFLKNLKIRQKFIKSVSGSISG